MRNFKDAIFLLLFGLLIILFIVDIGCAFHSTWFVFNNIHLTRMEAALDPGNYLHYKLLCIGATYLDFKVLTKLAENRR
ncbi:MAG: hypothetical protein NC548_28320 [Lachnospiraceae bacterium]|nr:hypothetical protein [Lachnospiraceae bacterium]MCM1231995.1 hypothetical protein [Ruminococcus flavefaciens]